MGAIISRRRPSAPPCMLHGVFGIFRYMLALAVVVSHLWSALCPWAGWYAVYGFYALSGWLMALVLDARYPRSRRGTLRFFANRGLRIYPPYWVVLAATLLFLALVPDVFPAFRHTIRWPDSAVAWLENLFIFGLVDSDLRLIPPAWSLDVELCFYLVMGVVAARTRTLSIVWLAISVVLTLHSIENAIDFDDHFISRAGSSLPFSLGAVAYHSRHRLPAWLGHGLAAPALVATFVLHLAFAEAIWGRPERVVLQAFYVSLVLATLCIAALSRVRTANPLFETADRFFGDLSYSIFLNHQLMAGVMIAWGVAPSDKVPYFFGAFALSNLAAWAVARGVEDPIESLRARIRSRSEN